MTRAAVMRGLLLTGGGARGAYQAGVLAGVARILGDRAAPYPFPILTGISAGALNAVFMDSIDGDLERLNRINATLSLLPPAARAQSPLRPIQALMLTPSEDLGAMAEPHLTRFPAKIRYLLRGLGAGDDGSHEFPSYILFDRAYTRELLDLGERDAARRRDEIEAFVRDDRETSIDT